jgi:hypothetical protein
MSDQGGVLGIMTSTFSLWASFRQSRSEPVLGLYFRYISDNEFVVVAVAVEAPVIKEFAAYVSRNSALVVGNIDGDPTPNALWLGHWTHFVMKRGRPLEPLEVPAYIDQSERALQRIIRRGIPSVKHGRRK